MLTPIQRCPGLSSSHTCGRSVQAAAMFVQPPRIGDRSGIAARISAVPGATRRRLDREAGGLGALVMLRDPVEAEGLEQCGQMGLHCVDADADRLGQLALRRRDRGRAVGERPAEPTRLPSKSSAGPAFGASSAGSAPVWSASLTVDGRLREGSPDGGFRTPSADSEGSVARRPAGVGYEPPGRAARAGVRISPTPSGA